ncbi:Receptor-like protein 14 [Citrus sinensis]|nr:Receptor-like protein 14 [Citrus sinensis]
MRAKDEVLEIFVKLKKLVETETGRKIKVLRSDNGGEYTSDPFLQVCQNEGIKRHFTVRHTLQQNGVTKHMNRTLLENVWCMLSNVGLDKKFWAEAMSYASHFVNRLPYAAIGGKTPMEMWSGKHAQDYDSLRIFGCPAYYHVKDGKLDPRARKVIFVGFKGRVKGFKLWDLEDKKFVCSRDVTFDEVSMMKALSSQQMENKTKEVLQRVEFDATPYAPVSSTSENDSTIEVTPRVEEELTKDMVVVYALPVIDDDISNTFGEALCNSESDQWKLAMEEEMKSLHQNQTWKFVKLPKGKRAIVTEYELELAPLDVTTFLHGDLEEEIYITQPCGFKVAGKENHVCRLIKSLYGLKQSPRQWYKRFDQFIQGQKFTRSEHDHCVYFRRLLNGAFIYLLLYGDDMLIALKNKDEIEILKKQLASEFEIKDLGDAHRILGMEIRRDKKNESVWLTQKSYLKKVLKRFERDYMARVPYTSAVGSLMYAMVCTRPNIFQAVSMVSRYMNNPEYMATTEVVKEAIWLKGLLGDLGVIQENITVFCNNQSVIFLAKNQTYHARTKHIDVKYHYVREIIESGVVLLRKIDTKDNPSDMLIKGVKCNLTTQRVMQLSLSHTTKFNYSYDPLDQVSLLNMSLFDPFQELQSLDLSENWFEGVYENRETSNTSYPFVACDGNGRLKQLKILNLEGNNFNDIILPYLNTLTSLTTLILRGNKIEGSKSRQGLANLRYLQVLDLSGNTNITGGSLTRLGLANLENLKTLDLGYCGLTTLQGLANFINLQVLDLSCNFNITRGSLERQGLANLTKLKSLGLDACGITTLQGLTNLTNLKVLDLSGNSISLSVTWLGLHKLKNLEALDLSFNNINGTVESQGICELKNLFELNLARNNIGGDLPDCLNNLTRLKVLDTSFNQLSGSLPSVIVNLTSLEYLDLSNGYFEGIFPISSLANHSKLKVLLLSTRNNNMLQLKTENFLPTFQLKVLRLPVCNLKVIPNFLVHQHELKYLDLSHNNLAGDFPTWILQNNTKLEVLCLTNNSFTGNLQLPHSKHDFLHHLDVSSNNFTGNFDLYGFELRFLPELTFSSIGTYYNSTLDLRISEGDDYLLPQLVKVEFVTKNRYEIFDGSNANYLVGLDLSCNQLTGDIPSEIGELQKIPGMNLSHNSLSGSIPESFSNLKMIESLDLSHNRLNSQI